MRKRRKKSWEIIQVHHLSYEPEVTVKVTRTEHFFSGRLNSYGKARGFTPGFCKALRYMIKQFKKEGIWPKKKEKSLLII